MGIQNFLRHLLPPMASTGFQAAALPPAPPMQAPKEQESYPGYRKQIKASTSVLPKTERRLANTDTLTLRNAATTKAAIRSFSIASPDLSATVNSYLRVGIPENYTVVGRNMDGSINPEGTQLAQEILRRVTFVPDYTQGFNATSSVYTLACALGKELMYYASAALEVALDAARLPVLFAPVHTPSLAFYEDEKGLRPVQVIGGEEIDLDIPTFLYTSIDQDLLDPYSSSMLEAALQPVLADQDFMNDLRRVLKRAIHPRVTATIIEEMMRKSAPLDIVNDSKQLAAYYEGIMAAVEQTLEEATPEQALVSLDMIKYEYMKGDPGDVPDKLKVVQSLLNAKTATGAKSMPAILGHGQGGNHASTEAILFVKNANVLRMHIGELFSRALTISCRLMGQDIYVEFKYASIDLRPDSELEAYKAMEQSRLLELNSLGYLTDEETSVRLTGNLPPPGMAPLAGTMFKTGKSDAGNPDSNTSAMNQELKPSTPAKPKSPSK